MLSGTEADHRHDLHLTNKSSLRGPLARFPWFRELGQGGAFFIRAWPGSAARAREDAHCAAGASARVLVPRRVRPSLLRFAG